MGAPASLRRSTLYDRREFTLFQMVVQGRGERPECKHGILRPVEWSLWAGRSHRDFGVCLRSVIYCCVVFRLPIQDIL